MINLITNFFKNTMPLSLIFLGVLITYITFEILVYFYEKRHKYQISYNKLTLLFNHNNALIIDIRPKEIYNNSHIVNSINIAINECNQQHNLIKSNIGRRPIIIVDADAKEAKLCAANLRKSGGQDVWFLHGGLFDWQQHNMPLISSKGAESKCLINIIIYTKDDCPYCLSAKNLLRSKSYNYQEIKISDFDSKEYKQMLVLSNGLKTVPQIFINDLHIGGFDNLKDLNDRGELSKIVENI